MIRITLWESTMLRTLTWNQLRVVLVLLGAAVLSGCASFWPQTAALREALPPGLPERVELTKVPFFPQEDFQCGSTALAILLASAGVEVMPHDLESQVYLPERKGALQVEMLAAARRYGLVSYELAPSLEDVLREIAAGTPVILLQNQGLVDGWHYAVAIGYDYETGELILRSGRTERQVLPFTVNEMIWKRSGYWAMVAMPPERIAVTADEARWLSAVAALERVGTKGSGAAQVAYASFLKRWPANIGAAIGLANTHYAHGGLRDAETALREAHRRAPDSVVVLNNLAQVLSDQGRGEEALPFIDRAAALGGASSGTVQQTRQSILDRISTTKK